MSHVSPHGRDLAIWIAVFTFVIFVVLGLRFYVIFKVKRRDFRLDDGVILLSVAALLAMEGTTLWAIHNGLGARTAELDWAQISVTIKLLVSAFWTWTISTCACKIALLYLYLEIFRHNVVLRRLVWLLVTINTAYIIIFISFFMTQCDHVSDAWDPVRSVHNCRPREVHEIASVAANLALDLSVIILPLPAVWKLQMPVIKKIGVTIMFTLGAGVIGIMCWRLHSTIVPVEPADLVYDTYLLALQSHLELWLGILAASMPTLGPLIGRIPVGPVLKKWLGSFSSSKRSSKNRVVKLRDLPGGNSSSGRRSEAGSNFVKLPGETKGRRLSESEGGILRSDEYHVSYSHPESV